jgi:bifunctional non-homologous end joining protein LigD
MLARSARMPTRGRYSYEPKLDGFRAILSTEHGFVVYSRRRWNMAPLVPELQAFPVRGTFDGELIAFADGQPDFVALTDRMLLGCGDAPIALAVFDVLSLEGASTMREPCWRRREILDSLELAGPCWSTVPAFDDGAALWQVVCAQEMEGVVAKPRTGIYRPGERRWLKVKNRAYWKYELAREAVITSRAKHLGARSLRAASA